METKNRTVLFLTDEAVRVLGASATERKRGEFVSNLLVQSANISLVDEDKGIMERLEARLMRIEQLLMKKLAMEL